MPDKLQISIDEENMELTINGERAKVYEDADMPLQNLGDVKQLDVMLIYDTNPRCVWWRGRLYCA